MTVPTSGGIVPKFHGTLAIEEAGENEDGEPMWRLTRELVYDSEVLGARLVIPVGFETDLSSIPRYPFLYWWLGGRGRKAGVAHDFAYRTHICDRETADRMYPEALSVSEDVPKWVRGLMYAGLRWKGGQHW